MIPTLAQRIAATIDAANMTLSTAIMYPVRITHVTLEEDHRLACVFLAFEDGETAYQPLTAACLNVNTLIETAIRGYMMDHLGLCFGPIGDLDDDEASCVDVIAYASGEDPASRKPAPDPSEDADGATHTAPERAQ